MQVTSSECCNIITISFSNALFYQLLEKFNIIALMHYFVMCYTQHLLWHRGTRWLTVSGHQHSPGQETLDCRKTQGFYIHPKRWHHHGKGAAQLGGPPSPVGNFGPPPAWWNQGNNQWSAWHGYDSLDNLWFFTSRFLVTKYLFHYCHPNLFNSCWFHQY